MSSPASLGPGPPDLHVRPNPVVTQVVTGMCSPGHKREIHHSQPAVPTDGPWARKDAGPSRGEQETPARSPRKPGTDGAQAPASGCTGAPAGLRAVTAWAQPGRPRNSLQREPGRERAGTPGPDTSVQKTRSWGQKSGAGTPRKQPPHGVLIAPEQFQLKIGCREQGGESRADVTYCVSEYR